MVPHWTIPNAITLGNTLDPQAVGAGAAQRRAHRRAAARSGPARRRVQRRARRARGGRRRSATIPDIEAITFVGSTHVAKVVYRRATAHLKRVLALGGAKNHLIVMPDADPEMAAANVVASMAAAPASGAWPRRVMVAVSADRSHRRADGRAGAKHGPGRDARPGDLRRRRRRGSSALHHRGRGRPARRCWSTGADAIVPGREGGFYVGPTVIDHVRPTCGSRRKRCSARCWRSCARATSTRRSRSRTRRPTATPRRSSPRAAAWRARSWSSASAGMVGVNVGVPVPREPFALRRLERLQVRRRRHHRQRLDRVLDQGEEDHHEVESRGRDQLDVEAEEERAVTMTAPARPAMPPSDHRPRPYTGPSRQEVLALRRQYCHPSTFTVLSRPADGRRGVHAVSVRRDRPAVPRHVRRHRHRVRAATAIPGSWSGSRPRSTRIQHTTTIYLHPNFPLMAKRLARRRCRPGSTSPTS